jgi:glycosyltransferase involved in cell wall biosynthesis
MINSISVIICTYAEERWNNLVASIESVQQQTLPPQEIVVVIDHNPTLLKRVQEQIPGVIVVENREACGYCGSRNSGIAVAKSPIIAYLDDDAVAAPDWLMLLSEGFTDSKVLGVGGSITPLWMCKQPTWFPEEFYWVVSCTFRGMPQSTAVVRNLIGTNMALRREIFDAVGGFRIGRKGEIGRKGTWPISGDENELCIRTHQFWPQSVFIYLPQARVFHHVPGRRASWRYFYLRCYAEGLSKAIVAQYVGIKDGLAVEYTYTCRTLPRGVMRGLTDALFHRDPTGLVRAGAIVVGFVVTMTGYLVGTCLPQAAKAKNIIARVKVPRHTPNYHNQSKNHDLSNYEYLNQRQ